ncbi:uncharacterized protein PFL1_00228 [Pseudozyma flocculosa PF-1]|uniref:N-acetyltransferase domain-containing protein n=1 Tax=Pseudozyma flocculosa TaxID=84751 RepID=A0A5C3ERW1_9BASI|nr:uncharacterized protein PFL1_00228 [Pseudozyma flocculosa PF-1]EPQ32030.1 hypothetical protein PFL1_00228 [Pseudozyma flocculosa PF-1]SPO35044.1 uncharacterized protein PSFLO_00515 [Pseudozyma flocculosa]
MPGSNNDEYSVHLCTSAAQLRQAHRVRCEVFVTEQGYGLEEEVDQYDPVSAHFVLVHKGDPSNAVGVVRLVPYPLPIPKQDPDGVEPNSKDFPLGGSQSESSTASHFVSAVFGTNSSQRDAAHDPTLTDAEEKRTEDLIPNLGGAKLGRLAVLKEARGKGLAQRLVREAEAWLINVIAHHTGEREGAFGPPDHDNQTKGDSLGKHQKVQSILIKISSQEYIQQLYKKMEYSAVGDVYLEEGQPHVLMYKELVLNAKSP